MWYARPASGGGPPAARLNKKRSRAQDHGLDDQALAAAIRAELGFNPLALGPPPMPERARRLDWAGLLESVFEHDLLTCHKCGGRRDVRAFVSSPSLAREALVALRVPFEPLWVAKGHDPPSQESFDLAPGPGFDAIDPSYPD